MTSQHTGRFERRQGGFTLIELIACIVIMGILAAVTAPRFVNMQTFTQRGYADDIASSLRYARRIAVASGCKVRVTIDGAGYSAWQQATHAACNGAGAWTTQVLRPDGTPLDGTAPNDVNIAPASVVEFWSSGAAATGSAAITVGTHTVSIDGATGRVSVQ
jgi:MSHA pilin protein MshC